MSKFRGILNDDCCEYLSTSPAAEEFRNSVDIGEVAGESVVYCGRWQPSMQSRVYATGARPSVCLSVCLSVPPGHRTPLRFAAVGPAARRC